MTLSLSSRITRNQLIIGMFLTMVTVSMWVYSKDRLLHSDEVIYSFNLARLEQSCHSYTIPFDPPRIQSFADVFESMSHLYVIWSGRYVPHFIEQTFSGVWPMSIFFVLNALVFGAALFLMAYIATNHHPWRHLWVWIMLWIGFIGMPFWPTVFSSINYSVNYLWPLFFALILWIWWERLRDNVKRYPFWIGVPTFILAFIMGWTHEAIIVPLSATIVLWYICHRRFPRRACAWLVWGFLAGAAAQVFSPGNFSRFRYAFPDDLNVFESFICTWIELLLVASWAIYFLRNREKAMEWLRDKAWGVVLCVLAWVFILFIHSYTQSFLFVNAFGLTLLISLYFDWQPYKAQSPWATRGCTLMLLLLGIHFGCTAYDQNYADRVMQRSIQRYMEADDELFILPNSEFGHSLTRPWMKRRFNCHRTISLYYSHGTKEIIEVDQSMFDAIADSANFFIPANRIPGEGPYYWRKGMEQAVCHPDSMGRRAVIFNLQPLALFDKDIPIKERFRRILRPNQVCNDVYSVPQPTPSPIGMIQFATLPPHRIPIYQCYYQGPY